MNKVKDSLTLPINKITYWTDSTIVLSWIRCSSKTWKTFVANRISEIHELTNASDWNHVSTAENPADILELRTSMNILLKIAQQQTFKAELQLLQTSKSLCKSSTILSLNPFVDNEGLLRVGGRLKHADSLNPFVDNEVKRKLLPNTGLSKRHWLQQVNSSERLNFMGKSKNSFQ
ncbi:hypothetical protein QE152_g21718 [Popillia japonica]|uniref:Uncharacterized protein n=1 Tax=Popillia japonica TaxID=7064 RepID=A0AAW1KMI4_POPJA